MQIPTPENTPLTVADPKDPRSSYMLSKILGEALCAHACIPYTAVRFHNVYGPRMGLSHVIPELLKKAYCLGEQNCLEVYSPSHTRAFCYIDDAVDMLEKVIKDEGYANDVFNVGSESGEISIKELAAVILDVTERKNKLELKEDTPGSPERRAPSMSKFSSVAGEAKKTPLRDGISRTYEWYKVNVFDVDNISAI